MSHPEFLIQLREAAHRCDTYPLNYGVWAEWILTTRGMKLEMKYGGDTVTKHVHWDDIAGSKTDLLKETEDRALAGLSS